MLWRIVFYSCSWKNVVVSDYKGRSGSGQNRNKIRSIYMNQSLGILTREKSLNTQVALLSAGLKPCLNESRKVWRLQGTKPLNGACRLNIACCSYFKNSFKLLKCVRLLKSTATEIGLNSSVIKAHGVKLYIYETGASLSVSDNVDTGCRVGHKTYHQYVYKLLLGCFDNCNPRSIFCEDKITGLE